MNAGATASMQPDELIENLIKGVVSEKTTLEEQLLMLIHQHRKRQEEWLVGNGHGKRPHERHRREWYGID